MGVARYTLCDFDVKRVGVVLCSGVLLCRVRLSKRRAKAGAQSTTNAVLVCKHRDMNEKELEAQVSILPLNTFLKTVFKLGRGTTGSALCP